MESYEKKVAGAIRLIQSIPQDGPIEVAYSGGKDSDVILELTKMSGIPFVAVYKQTTVDPPGTTAHVKKMGVVVLHPSTTLLKEIEKHGPPSRRVRWCCAMFKEYPTAHRVILGIRRDESRVRAERYTEPEICRSYGKGVTVRQYFPILEWTKEDVERFIKERGIECAPRYYDENGVFHVERRLGCLGCPMSQKGRIKDFKEYPKLLKEWVKATWKWMDSHPDAKSVARFGNAYNLMYANLFTNSWKDYEQRLTLPVYPVGCEDIHAWRERYFGKGWKKGCGAKMNTRLFLEDTFGIKFEDIYGKQ